MYKRCGEYLRGLHPSTMHRRCSNMKYDCCGESLRDVDPSRMQCRWSNAMYKPVNPSRVYNRQGCTVGGLLRCITAAVNL